MYVPAAVVLEAMGDSTTSSTMANDLDLIYLKGIMESPMVWYKHKLCPNSLAAVLKGCAWKCIVSHFEGSFIHCSNYVNLKSTTGVSLVT